jgi:hypothetical protein
MHRLSFMLVPIAGMLFGCATEYQSNTTPLGSVLPNSVFSFSGGFTETQIDTNVWRVSFRGNRATDTERTADFALLRSAELALANNFTHFAFAASNTVVEKSAYVKPVTATTTGSVMYSGNMAMGSSTTQFSGGGIEYTSSNPTSNNTVVMFKGKPEINAMVYDASFICSSLGKKYNVICNAPKK